MDVGRQSWWQAGQNKQHGGRRRRRTWTWTYEVEFASKIWCTTIAGLVAICLVGFEKLALVLQGVRDGTLVLNVSLTSVDDGDIAESEGDDSSSKNVDDIGALVHEVNLGQDTDGPLSLGVNLAGELETVRVGQIGVCGSDGEDDGVGLANLLQNHVLDLLLNVSGLVSNRHLGQAGQIDKGQGEDVGRVDAEVDGGGRDAGVAASL